jgi:hypothetical protein
MFGFDSDFWALPSRSFSRPLAIDKDGTNPSLDQLAPTWRTLRAGSKFSAMKSIRASSTTAGIVLMLAGPALFSINDAFRQVAARRLFRLQTHSFRQP